MKKLGIPGREPDRFGEVGQSAAEFPFFQPGMAAIVECGRKLGIDTDRFGVSFDGLVDLASFDVINAAAVGANGACRPVQNRDKATTPRQ